MWDEAGVLTGLSLGALLLYAGVGMSLSALGVLVGGRGGRPGADEDAGRRGSPSSLGSVHLGSASLGSVFVRLCLALCLAALGAFTLYLVVARLRG